MAKSNLLYLKSTIQFRWLSSTASFRKESNSNVDLRARKVKTSIMRSYWFTSFRRWLLRFCSDTFGVFAVLYSVPFSKSLFQCLENVIFSDTDKQDGSYLLRNLHHNNLLINLPLLLTKRATVQSLLREKGKL